MVWAAPEASLPGLSFRAWREIPMEPGDPSALVGMTSRGAWDFSPPGALACPDMRREGEETYFDRTLTDEG